MYARIFSTLTVVAPLTLASALAQEGPNLQPTEMRETDNTEYRAWVRELTAHLLKNMTTLPRSRTGDRRHGRVIIRFVLDRAGHIESARIEKSSGDPVLDTAALVRVRLADPVPLPPPSLTDLIFYVPLNF
jgi:TonB family protein